MLKDGTFEMKTSASVLFLFAFGLIAQAQQAMPRMTTIDPGNGKVGDILIVSGENLDKAQVEKIYLTDGKNDLQVDVSDQAATSVKIKIPAKAKPGRFALMLLTTGKEPKFIEQPVKLTVE
jgi:hypothetical protein